MNSRHCLTLTLLLFLSAKVISQEGSQSAAEGGRVSGNLQINGNFFMRDSSIGAANIPQYDRQLYGADTWLNLNYAIKGFDFGLRFDAFQNSNLLNPTGSYTDQGIGRWYAAKQIHKLGISAGYLYDIIGSGIIFRAYEERSLAIDQALYGVRLTYELTPDWKVKAFSGRQKQQFSSYESSLRGVSFDGFVGSDSSKLTLAPGFGVVGRTIDDKSMNNFVANLNTYRKQDVFEPRYNAYAMSAWNTLTWGAFSWYIEGAYKTKDSYFDPLAERITASEDTVTGRYFQGAGNVFYTSLSYTAKGFSITVERKRTEKFDFRARPQEEGTRGLLHYIPPMSRVNTYRLPARYAAATQYFGEHATQLDVRYAVNKSLSFNVNFSNINHLNDVTLYQEIFTEVYYKHQKKWRLLGGVQFQDYNQEIYYGKPGAPVLEIVTPYADFLYKFDKKKSIRFEAQYMNVAKDHGERGDYGNWAFGLVELGIAPHWSFTASDMFNIDPGKASPVDAGTGKKEKIHYPRFDVYYTQHANRFSLSYVKQVEGIVCSGGICRLEPAFSGVKLTVNSTF